MSRMALASPSAMLTQSLPPHARRGSVNINLHSAEGWSSECTGLGSTLHHRKGCEKWE